MADDVLRQWFQVIDDDLDAVRACLAAEKVVVRPAAYHCQQAAEKMVKCLIAAGGGHPPKIHDVAALVKLLGDHPLAGTMRPFGRFTVYAAAYRYPGAGSIETTMDDPSAKELADWLAELEAARAALERHAIP